jgi:hypothetical protein
VNLQYKRVFWPEEKRWVRLRISTKVFSNQCECLSMRVVCVLHCSSTSTVPSVHFHSSPSKGAGPGM